MHLRQWRSFGSTNCGIGERERASEAIVSCMQRGSGISLGTGMEMEWKGNIRYIVHSGGAYAVRRQCCAMRTV